MVRASERHDGMPSIRRTTKRAAGQSYNVEVMPPGDDRADSLADRQHRRQSLRRPENRLFVERLLRISRERTDPIAVGSRPS